MTKQTDREKLINNASNYVFGRIKMILLMVFLMIIVKEHPVWDAAFGVILALQIILSFIVILRLPEQISEASRKRYEEGQREFKEKWGNYGNNSYQRKRPTIFNTDIDKSAQILGVNIIQDSNDDIKKKYRKLAMKWHPDKFASDTIENQEKAKRNFQKVNGAYQKIKEYKNIN